MMSKIKSGLPVKGVFIVSVIAVALLIGVSAIFLLEDIRGRNPAKAPIAAVAVPAMNCTLVVPADPLHNLATPWQLSAPCNEANPNQAVFVQAVVFDLDTHTLSTYAPLVIDAGTTPAITPTAPVFPPHAVVVGHSKYGGDVFNWVSANTVVGVFGGGDDVVTTLTGAGAGQCDNGAAGRLFGQVFFCNTRGLFSAINRAHISIPPIGVEKSGLPCPTVRDFRLVDQDQSDNVTATYLVNANGQTAQNTVANRLKLGDNVGFKVVKNGSDNRLLDTFVDPAVGCTPWAIADLADPGVFLPTQATNELQAAAFQGAPMALIPAGDPMVGPNVLAMVNTYRLDIDQPRAASLADASTSTYCENQAEVAHSWITLHTADFQGPSPTVGMNLEAFLLDRLAAARLILKCAV